VRVHEELVASGSAELSYAALTAFCRRHGIGYRAKYLSTCSGPPNGALA
jgi:hypothetical protein